LVWGAATTLPSGTLRERMRLPEGGEGQKPQGENEGARRISPKKNQKEREVWDQTGRVKAHGKKKSKVRFREKSNCNPKTVGGQKQTSPRANQGKKQIQKQVKKTI